MEKKQEDCQYFYKRILAGESVWLTSKQIKGLEEYASEVNGEKLLNNMISEPTGDDTYKCYITE